MPLKGVFDFLVSFAVVIRSVAKVAEAGEVLWYSQTKPRSGYVMGYLYALHRATDNAPSIVSLHHLSAYSRRDVASL